MSEPKKVRVQLVMSASGMVCVDLYPEVAKEIDRLVKAGQFSEAALMLEGDAYREAAMDLLFEGAEIEEITFPKKKKPKAGKT